MLLSIAFQLVVILYSITIHEVAHGVVANKLGDPTAKNLGRLTLNPFKHLDFFGSILLPLFSIFLSAGRAVFGYAKPIPHNPANLRDQKFGSAKVALAGPAVNIVLAVLFGLVIRFMPDIFYSPQLLELLSYVVFFNLVLALFNLFPIPPLDGHWLLMVFLPARFMGVRVFLYKYSIFLLLFFIIFIFPIIFPITSLAFRILTGLSF